MSWKQHPRHAATMFRRSSLTLLWMWALWSTGATLEFFGVLPYSFVIIPAGMGAAAIMLLRGRRRHADSATVVGDKRLLVS